MISHETNTAGFELFKRLIKEHLLPNKKYLLILAAAVVCMVIAASCTAFLAKTMEPVIDEVFVNKDASRLYFIAGFIFFVFFFNGVSTYGHRVLMDYVGFRIVTDLQKRLFSHLMILDLDFFHKNPSGTLVSRFTHDLHLLKASVSSALTSIGKEAMTVLGLALVMFYQDWRLACTACVVFPIGFLPLTKIKKRMRKVSAKSQFFYGELTTNINQTFQGIRLIKSYCLQKYESVKTNVIVDKAFKIIMKASITSSASHPLMEFLGGLAIVAIIFYGGSQVIEGTKTAGTFFSFITAFLLAYQPIKKLVNLNINLQQGIAATDRLYALLDEVPLIEKNQKKKITVKDAHINFKDVTFNYEDHEHDKTIHTLKKLNINVEGGKTIALVGPSGAGKSTILNLLLRFYDPAKGSITIDGQDIKNVSPNSLRDHIAVVNQDIILFNDTLKSNIQYGNLSATQKDIEEAAKHAFAHDFIKDLPDGYDTIVGERGMKLSGGQRQRISIARAFLKNAPILLFDEATSALDSESEKQIQMALNTLMSGKTTILIAHRLSTVAHADMIYVIDKGEIVEFGRHKELIKNKSMYKKLYDHQFDI